MKLSAVLIAHNEAHRIARCLDSVRFADEIVVVVSATTTDESETIARRYTDRVFRREFKGFSDQRQWADQQATGDWILSVDCDEVVPEGLAAEIRAVLAAPRHSGYRIPHLDYMFGRWIRHGGWYPQYHRRLYRRGAAQWTRDVHEYVTLPGDLGTLEHPILHYSHARVSDWVNKMARYTTLEAEAKVAAGRRPSAWRTLLEPPLYAGYKYVYQQGWRDGWHGLALALLLGCYRLVSHLKHWDLHQAAKGPKEAPECPPRTSRSSS